MCRSFRRTSLAALLSFSALPAVPAGDAPFRRGDVDADGLLTITDAIRVLGYLFLGGDAPACFDAADTDDDGRLNITDPVYLLDYAFRGGPPPPPPHPTCGADPTLDPLECESFPGCAEPSEIERVRASFGVIRTIAGKGEVATEGANSWQPGFEGGYAVEAELSAPHIALGDDAGNVYIADKEAHAIRKVTPDGRISTVAGTGVPGDDGDGPSPGVESRLREPNGLWVLGDGTVYILDTDNIRVRRLDPGGTLETVFYVPNLRTGRGLWVSDDGDLAYVSSRTQLLRWRRGSPAEALPFAFQQLGNLAVDRDGSLIVTDRDAHLVYRITPDLERIPIAGNGTTTGGGDGRPGLETGLAQVRGVWIHEPGGLFLAAQAGSQVWYLDTDGIIHLLIDGRPDNVRAGDGELFSTPGPKVSNIRSVTMDRRGNLLITENDFGFVRRVERR